MINVCHVVIVSVTKFSWMPRDRLVFIAGLFFVLGEINYAWRGNE